MASCSITVTFGLELLLLAWVAAGQLPPACHPSGFISDSSGSIARLPDRRVQGVMPSTLPLSVMESEGATYHALFAGIINLQAWAVCGMQPLMLTQQAQAKTQTPQQQQQQQSSQQQQQQQQGQELKYPAPTGWVTTKVITIKGLHNGKVVDVPTAVVLQDAHSHAACKPHNSKKSASSSVSQLLVLMRGALLQTDYTWYAFASNLAPAPEVGPGLLHQGAVNASSQLWSNGLQQALDDAFASPCPPSSITLAGHSFGGVGVTLLAPRVARYVQHKTAAKQPFQPRKTLLSKLLALSHQLRQVQPPLVSAVMFGSPPVSDAVYPAHFNRMVNTRRLEFELDPYNVLFIAWSPVPGFKPDPRFARVGGIVSWGPAAMPLQKQQWAKLASFSMASPMLQQSLKQATGQRITGQAVWSSATHICSYMCKAASFTKTVNNWCLLHADKALAGRQGTYCYSTASMQAGSIYPTAPVFP